MGARRGGVSTSRSGCELSLIGRDEFVDRSLLGLDSGECLLCGFAGGGAFGGASEGSLARTEESSGEAAGAMVVSIMAFFVLTGAGRGNRTDFLQWEPTS